MSEVSFKAYVPLPKNTRAFICANCGGVSLHAEGIRKVMGMGHREYKVKDPRSYVMEEFLRELSEKKNDWRHYEILKEIERQFRERMEEKGKPLYPNVDFFSGAVYTLLGIPKILFTPVFAMARVSGWLAHILEQREHGNRIYRPESLYRGSDERPYVPMAERG